MSNLHIINFSDYQASKIFASNKFSCAILDDKRTTSKKESLIQCWGIMLLES